jgi:lysozyme
MSRTRQAVGALVLAASTLVGIAKYEGYKSEAYLPTPNDVPTIDFGRTKGVKMGDKSNPVRGLMLLEKELDTVYVAGVKRCVKVPLYDYEFGAYVSFTYNVGVGAFCGSTLVEKLNAGDYAGACAEISRWNKQKGKVLDGLTARREEERAVCEGKYAES